MRDYIKTLICTLLMIPLFTGISFRAAGQEKLNIVAGVGLPELINIGLRYQLTQAQIGLSVGTLPTEPGEKIVAISGDVFLHFGSMPKYSTRRPWFARIGLNWLRDETENAINKYGYINARLGRDLNISRKIGVALDAGAIFEISNDEIRKKPPTGWNLDLDFPVLPSLGLTLFYRI